MNNRIASISSSLVALAVAGAFATAVSIANAQDKPAPPPAWHQGKGGAYADSKLAPNPGKNTETAPNEIPLDKLKVPAGFKVELWAHGLPGGRAMARGDKGKIYVGTRALGRVYEVTDEGGKRSVRVIAEKMVQPAGVAFSEGSLYVMAINKVLRYDGIESNPNVQPVDLTDKFSLPPEQHHNWKYIAFGPDKKLYVPFGAPCNICEPAEQYAQIRRYNRDGSGMEVIARGVRNSVGFDFHPKTGELWFTDHGRDWMGDDGPQDELNRIGKTGEFFGYPYCHANGVPDADIKKADPCKGVTLPVALMGPHAAAMGVKFYTGTMFPQAYQGTMFIARKGSWNRTKKFGYDVITVTASPDGKNAKVTPFLTGFLDEKEDKFWGRPAYILQMPDGALLVSDEQMGAIYRISYASAPAAKK
jgi:glucose/arabinose dehydrogenase